MLGAGITLWFVLPRPILWIATALACLATAAAAAAIGRGGRLAHAIAVGAVAMAAGVAVIGWRAERVAAPVLARPVVAGFTARVERVEPLVARQLVRLTLVPIGSATDGKGRRIDLPDRVRVNVAVAEMPKAGRGAVIRLRARLMPPPTAAVPGAYDYARVAWFAGIGATGRGLAPIAVLRAGQPDPGIRAALTAHIIANVPGSAGGVAAALATGDTGAIDEADAEAMRAAGLAHLLSVSGLHITAVVGATMVLVLRVLALIPALALRLRLPLVAAMAGAGAAIGYTLLTGAEVPTIRSCVAALLVLAALALGREAMTLRLVAGGALVVLLAWPEALAGPSFQLSFAAITAIVALHDHPALRRFGQREERGWRRLARDLLLLLATGVVVELALMPIAVYHFHRAGLYGALANIIAIPLTTFVIMPLELLALLLDMGGVGAPVWWLTERALGLLLWLAQVVAASPGAVTAWAALPDGAFALMIGGGLWVALWRTRVRRWGAVPLLLGIVWALATPPPDLLVTGDGRHAAVRAGDEVAILRDRTGDYMRDVLAANGGSIAPVLLGETGSARCTRDLCLAEVQGRSGRRWRVLMTRSAYLVPAGELIAACTRADVVVSERRLPRRCTPRWLKLDRDTLAQTGGLAVTFANGRIVTVRQPGDAHPWIDPPRVGAAPPPRRPQS
ncbi:ComEC/Rec2 family competence protein [Sphingomonas sp. KR1UV-12]|uniref:ComEC/Rec2 family competence protein n=2 Tax=Sphingomonas aurea TaxID=3063994 RepID=A0ABT9EGN8_9SPHN|nr:ComEC/Rec2 family competence protein [Sphingomonas sp. KR1UV-12]MDP1026118.1 ComEC/Rec2 family competence protein [Sphingomonas sp. KR1UV-12]